jgi:acyl carrier protein
MDTETIIGKLKAILTEDMDLGLDSEKIDPDTPLFDGGLDLDSIVIVELIGAVEEKFGFQFEDADLRTSSFQDLASLAEVVQKRLPRPSM